MGGQAQNGSQGDWLGECRQDPAAQGKGRWRAVLNTVMNLRQGVGKI
jgi:hypothetical protein